MARPYAGYKNADAKRITGVTTVIGPFGDKGALIYAANKLGLDGKTIKDEWYTKAANIGTLVHDLFEKHLHEKLDMEPVEVDFGDLDDASKEKAYTALQSAVHWFDNNRMDIVWTEHPLVSEKLQVGGTPDALGIDQNGNHVILDWKSGGVYGSALFQVAAYKLLVEENFPDITIKGFHVVRFAKDTGDFVHRYYPELDEQVAAFPHMVRLYKLLRETEKRAK